MEKYKMSLLQKNRRFRAFLLITILMGWTILLIQPPIGSAALSSGKTPEEMGRYIFVTQEEMDEGFGDDEISMDMTLINAAGEQSQRRMDRLTFEMKKDGDKTLMTFQHPLDIKGTGLLTFEHIQGEDDQWLYLPALKRVKRIASKNKSGSFVGSEFSYEDLSSNEPEKYNYKYLREDIYQDQSVWVVERYPKDPNSGYTKIVTWVNQSNFQTVKQEFFDRKGSPLKIQYYNKIRQYLEKFWRPNEIIMENLQTQKKTVLKFEEWRFRQGLKESFFTKRSLERQR